MSYDRYMSGILISDIRLILRHMTGIYLSYTYISTFLRVPDDIMILDREGSITAPLDHEGSLKLEVALARPPATLPSKSSSQSAGGDAGGGGGGGGGGGNAAAPARLLWRRPLRTAAAVPPPRASNKWFQFELVCLSAAAN